MWHWLLELLWWVLNMPERKTVTLPLGPLWTRGDLVKAPEGASPSIVNCAFRRGVVEKRYGFKEDSNGADSERIFQFSGATANYLVTGTRGVTGTAARYSTGNGTWTTLTDVGAEIDATQYDGTLYMLGREFGLGSRQSKIDSFDGTTVTLNATTTRIGGTAITSHIGRLIVGSPTFYYDNGGSYLFGFDSGAEWTVGGAWAQPTGATIRLATIASGTTDTITSTAAVYTTGAADEYVTAVFEIQALSAVSTTPIKVSLQDAAGTTTYGLAQYVVSNATDDPEWRQYYVTALCPASTALYAKLAIGNNVGAGAVGVTFRLSDSDNNHGFSVYPGRFIYPFGAQTSTAGLAGAEYQNRIYWSEPLSFTDWRNENFAEVDEAPGPITALASVNGRLIVFKRFGIWIFAPTESALRPFRREAYLPMVGALGPTAVAAFENVLFFVGDNEVYAFDGGSPPKPLCGDAIRDEMFSSVVYNGVVAVDTDNREVWVKARSQRIYIFSIDANAWIGYYTMPALAAGNSAEDVTGMAFFVPYNSQSSREMWFALSYDNTLLSDDYQSYLLRHNSSTTLDFDTTDVVAEYVFHPLETPRPRQQMTVQEVGIDHKITGSQSSAETRYAFSTDGGSTFSKYNEVRVPVSTGASTDTDPIRVPLHQTAPRVVIKITHTGAGGPTYFNMTGAEASIILRGREIQGSNPTAVGSSL